MIAALKNRNELFFWAFCIIALIPWLSNRITMSLAGNVTWLLIGAERIFQGQGFLQHVYETNPPLCVFIYLPYVLLSNILQISLPAATTILTLAMIALSVLSSNAILKRFTCLAPLERHTILVTIIVALTLLSDVFFADREHLVLLALIPFLLCQYALTEKIKLPACVLYPVLLAGTIMILVKPHYGLLAVFMFAQRLIRQKRISIVLDADFLLLSAMTFAYAGIIVIFYHDYLTLMLPDALSLYIASTNKAATLKMIFPHLSAYLALFITESLMTDKTKDKNRLLMTLYGLSLLAIIPAYVQMKGYSNHMLPALSLFLMALGFSVSMRCSRFPETLKKFPQALPLLMWAAFYMILPPCLGFPRTYEIPQMPVAKFLDAECNGSCTFMAFHSDIEIMPTTAIYTQHQYGYRFPSYWFIPFMWAAEQNLDPAIYVRTGLTREQLLQMKEKYARYVAEDLTYYTPDILLIGTNISLLKDKSIDFIGFFSSNLQFKSEIENHYTKIKTFEFDRGQYFKGIPTLETSHIYTYDVYKRIK